MVPSFTWGLLIVQKTHGLANVFAITTGSSNEQTDLIPQFPSTDKFFGWLTVPLKINEIIDST
jgi:hypothetical protein